MHALCSCLTTTLVYHASVQGIEIRGIETTATGDLDARGFFGVSSDVKKGYEQIRVRMWVDSDASEAILTELAMYSPVYEMVSKAVPVIFSLAVTRNPEISLAKGSI